MSNQKRMIHTNKYGLSKLNFEWLSKDEYEKPEGSISSTDFGKSVREVVLLERYEDQVEIDVADKVFIRLGIAAHKDRSSVTYEGLIPSDRVNINFVHGEELQAVLTGEFDSIDLVSHSRNLSFPGMPDNLHYIDDLKVTSVWNIRESINAVEWRNQLSVYRYILQNEGLNIHAMGCVTAIMRDWKQRDAAISPVPIAEVPLSLLSLEETEQEIIIPKVMAILKSRTVKDVDLPMCREEERWRGDMKCKKYCWVRRICEYGMRYDSQADDIF